MKEQRSAVVEFDMEFAVSHNCKEYTGHATIKGRVTGDYYYQQAHLTADPYYSTPAEMEVDNITAEDFELSDFCFDDYYDDADEEFLEKKVHEYFEEQHKGFIMQCLEGEAEEQAGELVWE